MNSCINHSWDTCSSYNETVSRRCMYLHLGKTDFKIKYFISFTLLLAGIELILFAVARMGLCFGFLLETMLTTQGYLNYSWGGLAQYQGQGTKGISETTGHQCRTKTGERLMWGHCSGTGNCFFWHHLSFFMVYLSLLYSFFFELIFPHSVIKLFLYQPMRFLTFTLLILSSSPSPLGQEAE